MPNLDLFDDLINIYEETSVLDCTEWVETESLIYSDVPACLGCGEGNVDIFSCLPEKRTSRDICIEIPPTYDVSCKSKRIVVQVFRNGCDIGRYRIHDVIPQRFIRSGLDSYYMIGTLTEEINE